MAISLGADPELFIERSGLVVPIFGLVGGTKTNPRPMEGMSAGFAVQEDGAALEFNVPICYVGLELYNAIRSAKSWVISHLRTLYREDISFSKQNFIELSETDAKLPEANVIGCDADHYAWDESLSPFGYKRPIPKLSDFGNKRFAGYHIHIGYQNKDAPAHIVAKFMDLMVTLPVLYMDSQKSGRRTHYGLPGLYRPKPYGIEYRTLSSTILSKPVALEQTALMAAKVAKLFDNDAPVLQDIYNTFPWEEVRGAISTENYNDARKLTRLLATEYRT